MVGCHNCNKRGFSPSVLLLRYTLRILCLVFPISPSNHSSKFIRIFTLSLYEALITLSSRYHKNSFIFDMVYCRIDKKHWISIEKHLNFWWSKTNSKKIRKSLKRTYCMVLTMWLQIYCVLIIICVPNKIRPLGTIYWSTLLWRFFIWS